ncbi:MAG: DUF72 domain-containing protein [Candidatus Omnitrophota bacterium]|jgi:uncharacterized protein YecE (DUF72 family)
MKRKPVLQIGCSGWNYDHWKGLFYPRESSPSSWFKEYASSFSTVEINNTFYQLPEASTFKKWHDQASPDFIYAVKANRFITHMKKLKDPGKAVKRFLDRALLLKENLGPVLFQLPPHWRVNTERLDHFTDILPEGLQYVFEFREKSWYCEDVYKILSSKKMSLCLHDMKESESPDLFVGPVCYIRFHGSSELYGGKYRVSTLRKRAKLIKEAMSKGKDAYAYFNNDAEANAPKDALRLMKELGHSRVVGNP